MSDVKPLLTVIVSDKVEPNNAWLFDSALLVNQDNFFGLDRTTFTRLDVPLRRERVPLGRRLRIALRSAYWAFVEAWHG